MFYLNDVVKKQYRTYSANIIKKTLVFCSIASVSSCAIYLPKNDLKYYSFLQGSGGLGNQLSYFRGKGPVKLKRVKNACNILQQHPSWKSSLSNASLKWGIPKGSILSIIYHESNFKAYASNPASSAFGYAQVIDATWKSYKASSSNSSARRYSIYDAMDFVGWYNKKNSKRIGYKLKIYNTDKMYLSYHEGGRGYLQKTHHAKPWLLKKAAKVKKLAYQYEKQLKHCSTNNIYVLK